MDQFDVSTGSHAPYRWKTYRVQRSLKERQLRWVQTALRDAGCKVLHCSAPDVMPVFLVIETSDGQVQGFVLYLFTANSRNTKNRPIDEHRFQIKYGSDLSGVLEFFIDETCVLSTLILGIDEELNFAVSIDPRANNPTPMSRSVEFKRRHAEVISDTGWHVWSRDRYPPKSKDRALIEHSDARTETLFGCSKGNFLKLVMAERLSAGLDAGERHLLGERIFEGAGETGSTLLQELGVPADTLFDIIENANRLKMAVRGWVAEEHLFNSLRDIHGVEGLQKLDIDGQPDLRLTWKGAPILIECKNSLRARYANGDPRVDFQRTRASKGDPCSRYYRADEFDVLAVCLHAVEETWRFEFACTSDLTPHKKCPDRIDNSIRVVRPAFTDRPELVFDKCSAI